MRVEQRLHGIAVTSGIAIGRALVLDTSSVKQTLQDLLEDAEQKEKISADEVEVEITRWRMVHAYVLEETEQLAEETRKRLGDKEGAIFEAHAALLSDPIWLEEIESIILKERTPAMQALRQVTGRYREQFLSLEDDYMRERVKDLEDIATRLLQALSEQKKKSDPTANDPANDKREDDEREDDSKQVQYNADKHGHERTPSPTERIDSEDDHAVHIVVAHDLTPSEVARLDLGRVQGIALEAGGPTSHAAIIARAYGIPSVFGLKDILFSLTEQSNTGRNGLKARERASLPLMIIDGERGLVIINPEEETIQAYRARQNIVAIEEKAAYENRHDLAHTKDGKRIVVAANISRPEELDSLLDSGAEGVGLFRTEFLFMDRDTPPSEEEQYGVYRRVVEAFHPHAVIIRTMDIGGDKAAPYLGFPYEANPFLGYRAVRHSLDHPELLHTQLRAILRAGAYGTVKIMFPMITTIEEVRKLRAIVRFVVENLEKDRLDHTRAYEIGAMIETPAAALIARTLIDELDFFSIGTNDLIQYTLAVDRLNEHVAHLYEPYHPAVLRLIQETIDAAHAAGKWVGMCGEMAGDLQAIPLLLGMGLDEFSMSGPAIAQAKALIRACDLKACRVLAREALQKASAEEVKKRLGRVNLFHETPITGKPAYET